MAKYCKFKCKRNLPCKVERFGVDPSCWGLDSQTWRCERTATTEVKRGMWIGNGNASIIFAKQDAAVYWGKARGQTVSTLPLYRLWCRWWWWWGKREGALRMRARIHAVPRSQDSRFWKNIPPTFLIIVSLTFFQWQILLQFWNWPKYAIKRWTFLLELLRSTSTN